MARGKKQRDRLPVAKLITLLPGWKNNLKLTFGTMTLPVSSYEELLARVRSLTSETIQLRREITSSLCDQHALNTDNDNCPVVKVYATHPQRTTSCEERSLFSNGGSLGLATAEEKNVRPGSIFDKKEDEFDNEFKEIDEKLTSPDTTITKNAIHGSGWATDNFGLWHSGPSSLSLGHASNNNNNNNNFQFQDLTMSVTCPPYDPQPFNQFTCASKRTYSHQQLGAKVEMVYSLLSMLDTDNREDMSKTFLAMSSSPESCHAMRQSGCLPLLIQLIHSSELNAEVRNRAAEALHNIVHAQTDEKRRRREVRVLKLLQQVREYCDELKNIKDKKLISEEDSEKHPISAIGTLMKFSFDAEHRQAICTLGGLHAITDLIQVDHEAHDSVNEDSLCITLRRYAGMSLTNLTFGDGKNKALLCSFNKFMRALVDQLKSPSEELRQVTASVLRNLSWRADEESKQVLRNVGAVTALTVSAMEGKKESTLKSVLSALWNLSAHCSLNKIDICSVPGALAFLVKMLRYKSPSNTLAIVENAGGILRNISSHIAVREDYRQILRDNNCFEILLEQLKSPSLTIVSNACGTLWNLSARCPEDQKRLWEMGATTMLRSLIQSKHKMISMGSSAALKNLLAANPNKNFVAHLDSTAKSLGLQNLPTLFVRKKKALEQELNITLAETCENIEGIGSPNHLYSTQNKTDEKCVKGPKRSDSRDSVRSTQSDSVYERLNQIVQNQEKLFENNNVTLHDSLSEKTMPRKLEEQKLIRRYKTSLIPLPTLKKTDQDRLNEKTKKESCIEEDEDNFKEDSRKKIKKGIPVLNTRSLNKSASGLDFPNNKEEPVGGREEYLTKRSSLGGTLDSQVRDSLMVEEECKSSNRDKVNEEREYENRNCEPRLENAKLKGAPDVFKRILETKGSSEKTINCNNTFTESVKESSRNEVCERQKCDLISFCESVPLNTSYDSVQPNDQIESCQIENNQNREIRTIQHEVTTQQLIYPAQISKAPNFGEMKTFLSDRETMPLPNLIKIQSDDKQNDTLLSIGGEKKEHSVHSFLVEKEVAYTCQETGANLKEVEPQQNKTVDEVARNEDCRPTLDLNYDSDKCNISRKPSHNLLPDFKVGSPMTDSKVLQYEASKICREIKKHQDLDMGCSLTSEVSLISCSSFLDPMECSLIECSSDGIDFDEFENQQLVKGIIKANNPKTAAESVSLPSLGSLKNDQIEALELDNSILSITSFTSEIADVEVKDVNFDTYTKTCKNEDCQEQTIEDSTFPDGDETLNADSLQNGELYDDDSSLLCQENLPLDSEVVEDSTHIPQAKKLTPKEKRKTFCERYRTYTLKDPKLIEPPMAEVWDEGENVENIPTSVGTGNEFRDQYCHEPCNALQDSLSTKNYRESRVDSFEFSKSFDKKTIFPVGMTESKSLNDLLSVGPDERKELLDNAKLVAFSLKTAVRDFDGEVVSDSEADELQSSLAIDTATYSKNNRPVYSPEELQKFKSYGNHSTEELDKKGAKILKCDEKLESPKGVRGRRKPLYSSCNKTYTAVNPNLPKCSSKTEVDTNFSKPLLQREGTFTKEEGTSPKKTEAKTIRTIPVLNRNSEFKSSIPKPGARNVSAPALGISGTSKGTRPLSSGVPRANEKRNEPDSRRFAPSGNGNKVPHGLTPKRPNTANLSTQNTRPSSTQNCRTGGSPGLKSKSTGLQNVKSQSDASLNLVATKDKVAATKPKTPKKEVTSKIATLWKKVEETKQKNKNLKDRRLWIGPEKNERVGDGVSVIEQEEIVEIPRRKIIHSHTYQSLTDDTSATERKNFGGERSNVMKTGSERRNIVSAIVQPYNYNPPTSSEVISRNFKNPDEFYKSSLKVTTV